MPKVGGTPMAAPASVSVAAVAWMCYLLRAAFVTPVWAEAEIVLPMWLIKIYSGRLSGDHLHRVDESMLPGWRATGQ